MSKTSTRMLQPGLEAETTSRKVRLVSFGELLWDLFPDGPRLGGAAANVAFHAAQLGAESRLMSRVGDDERGHLAICRLASAGVLTADIKIDPRRPTGSVRVHFVDGQPQFQIEDDVAWDKIEVGKESSLNLKHSDIFCFSTLAQRSPLVRGGLQKLLTTLGSPHSARRPLRFLDLNLRPPYIDEKCIFESLALADAVKLNEEEARWLHQHGAGQQIATWLLDNFDLRFVALTLGAKGAQLSTRDEQIQEHGLKISGGDPVGAGDAFVAAFAVGVAEHRPLRSCLASANEYAAWVASQQGAMPVA